MKMWEATSAVVLATLALALGGCVVADEGDEEPIGESQDALHKLTATNVRLDNIAGVGQVVIQDDLVDPYDYLAAQHSQGAYTLKNTFTYVDVYGLKTVITASWNLASLTPSGQTAQGILIFDPPAPIAPNLPPKPLAVITGTASIIGPE
jgi:hypothetical protein